MLPVSHCVRTVPPVPLDLDAVLMIQAYSANIDHHHMQPPLPFMLKDF
jgi:hypothetical protein